jgi:phage shock protein A
MAANVHDLVDQFEEPGMMLRQAIREMEESLRETTVAAAQAIASENLLAKQAAEHERRAERWQNRAEEAVAAGNDDLARQALIRKHEHLRQARDVRQSLSVAQSAALSLRREIEAMRAKLAEARRRLATLTASQKAAEARGAIARGTARLEPQGFDRFEHLRDKVERAQAEALALGELRLAETWDPDAELEAHEQDFEIENELAALKARSSRPS